MTKRNDEAKRHYAVVQCRAAQQSDREASTAPASQQPAFTIERVGPQDIGLLIDWRMEVLHVVFADYENENAGGKLIDWEALRATNFAYYSRALEDGSHIACFAIPCEEGDAPAAGRLPVNDDASAAGRPLANDDAPAAHRTTPTPLPGDDLVSDVIAPSVAAAPIACGSICLHDELPSPDNPSGKCAYLMNMYTRPEFRGQGVAGAVVEWVIDQARKAGAGKIYLETTPAGRGVYERAGFTDLPAMMILKDD